MQHPGRMGSGSTESPFSVDASSMPKTPTARPRSGGRLVGTGRHGLRTLGWPNTIPRRGHRRSHGATIGHSAESGGGYAGWHMLSLPLPEPIQRFRPGLTSAMSGQTRMPGRVSSRAAARRLQAEEVQLCSTVRTQAAEPFLSRSGHSRGWRRRRI